MINNFTSFQDLAQYFDSVAQNMDMESFLDKCEQIMSENVERRFQTQANSDGSPWSSDLVDTGELRDSFGVTFRDGMSIEYGPEPGRNEMVAEFQDQRGNSVGGLDSQAQAEILSEIEQRMNEILER